MRYFEKNVLPKFFKHSSIRSLERQLHYYDFSVERDKKNARILCSHRQKLFNRAGGMLNLICKRNRDSALQKKVSKAKKYIAAKLESAPDSIEMIVQRSIRFSDVDWNVEPATGTDAQAPISTEHLPLRVRHLFQGDSATSLIVANMLRFHYSGQLQNCGEIVENYTLQTLKEKWNLF